MTGTVRIKTKGKWRDCSDRRRCELKETLWRESSGAAAIIDCREMSFKLTATEWTQGSSNKYYSTIKQINKIVRRNLKVKLLTRS